jgi:hypothetical protein
VLSPAVVSQHVCCWALFQVQKTVPADDRREADHLAEIGPMIEEMESTMRIQLDKVYLSKVCARVVSWGVGLWITSRPCCLTDT